MPRRPAPTPGNRAYAAQRIPQAARAVRDRYANALAPMGTLASTVPAEVSWAVTVDAIATIRRQREALAQAEHRLIGWAVLAGAPIWYCRQALRVSDSTITRALAEHPAMELLGEQLVRDEQGFWEIVGGERIR